MPCKNGHALGLPYALPKCMDIVPTWVWVVTFIDIPNRSYSIRVYVAKKINPLTYEQI